MNVKQAPGLRPGDGEMGPTRMAWLVVGLLAAGRAPELSGPPDAGGDEVFGHGDM
jgi:hypothetical protein